MKNTKKKFIGVIGLILVAIMTFVAALIPSPDVEAVDGQSVTTTIKVIVHDKYPEVRITSPIDSSTIVDGALFASADYENINYLDFYLGYENEFGEPVSINVGHFVPDPADLDPELGIASGSATIGPINLDEYNGYGDYTLTVAARGSSAYDDDIVSFTYSTISLAEVGKADNNDPIVRLDYNDEIYRVELQAYDAKGEPLFDEPIEYVVDPAGESGSKDFTLPFESYGAIKGDYNIVAIGYDSIDESNGTTYLDIAYAPIESPQNPNTGFFTSGTGISSEDYLITMLIVFGFSIFGGVYIITHSKKDQKRSRRR